MSIIATPSFTVSPVVAGGIPVYDAGLHNSLYYEDFESYATTSALQAAMEAAGHWKSGVQKGVITLDTAVGAEGSSKSMKVSYPASSDGTDADSFVGGSIAATSGEKPMHISWWYKITAGRSAAGDGNGHKMIEIDKAPKRLLTCLDKSADFLWCPTAVAYDPVTMDTNDGWCHTAGKTFYGSWIIYGGIGDQYHRAHANLGPKGNRDPYAYPDLFADGNWHQIVERYTPESAETVGDGKLEVWVGGVKVIDLDGTDVSKSNTYHKIYSGTVSGRWGQIEYPEIVNYPGWNNATDEWFDRVRVYQLK